MESYKEIVRLPSERKMWLLRKFYGGDGGALPPTDPRLLAMTPEQVELEFAHMQYDQQLKKGQTYEDDEFEDYDKETDADDSLLSEMPTLRMDAEPPKSVEIDNLPDEWEDVEIDDFEG